MNPTSLNQEGLTDLRRAHALLESPGVAIRISNMLGSSVEWGIERLPEKVQDKISRATTLALDKAKNLALMTIGDEPGTESSSTGHAVVAGITGFIGGAAGLAALPIELPMSTALIMRSIADIARSEGERLSDPDLPGQMMAVFAMGGNSDEDDGAESAYYATRIALGQAVSQAAKSVAARGVSTAEGPALARLIAQVAAKFEIQVSQKAAAQLVPIIGAFSGAAINTLFMDHFQQMARGHFIVRRLEREYGADLVKDEYQKATEA